ncbi:MAG: ribosome maturation factor RimM [Eubacteriales bacterium]
MQKYLEAGKIVNTHGVAGMVRLEPWCDSADVAASLEVLYRRSGAEYIPLKVERSSVHKSLVLVKFEGIDDFDAANKLKNLIVYCDRDDIPRGEGDIFIADLIGLNVVDAHDGTVYGKIADVINRGASDIYDIAAAGGEHRYLPAVAEFVDRIELGTAVYVTPIKGIFDEAVSDGTNSASDSAEALVGGDISDDSVSPDGDGE